MKLFKLRWNSKWKKKNLFYNNTGYQSIFDKIRSNYYAATAAKKITIIILSVKPVQQIGDEGQYKTYR